MVNIFRKTSLDLTPVEYNYAGQPSNIINYNKVTYSNGFSFYETPFLKNYQDVTINRGSCFILTNKINLQNIFTSQTTQTTNTLPVTICISPKNITNKFASYNNNTKRFSLGSSATRAAITVSPTKNKNIVELTSGGSFLQVKKTYPYEVTLSDFSLNDTEIERQKFYIQSLGNNLFLLKTKTASGDRFLTFGSDGILRATGVVLNNITPNNYLLLFSFLSRSFLTTGFNPQDFWVTYFNDTSQNNNNNVQLNQKNIITQNNFLIDFSVDEVVKKNINNINILTLKSNVTPTERPAPITNSYTPRL